MSEAERARGATAAEHLAATAARLEFAVKMNSEEIVMEVVFGRDDAAETARAIREVLAATAAQSRAWSDEDVARAAEAFLVATDDFHSAPAAMRAALATLPARPLAADARASAGVADDAAAEVGRPIIAGSARAHLDGWERLTREQQADVRAHIRGLTSDAPTYDRPPYGWTCFHCGETFKTPGIARLHFGSAPSASPTCVAEIAWLRAALERIANLHGAPVGASDGNTYALTGRELVEAAAIARAALEPKP